MRLCRRNTWRAEAQLELTLATAIKDNIKYFYKHISNKKEAVENFHSLLSARGNIATKDEEKSEVVSSQL